MEARSRGRLFPRSYPVGLHDEERRAEYFWRRGHALAAAEPGSMALDRRRRYAWRRRPGAALRSGQCNARLPDPSTATGRTRSAPCGHADWSLVVDHRPQRLFCACRSHGASSRGTTQKILGVVNWPVVRIASSRPFRREARPVQAASASVNASAAPRCAARLNSNFESSAAAALISARAAAARLSASACAAKSLLSTALRTAPIA